MKFFRIFAPDLAIDLGTANTKVARADRGLVVNEPTVVALNYRKLEILAIGEEAKRLIGKSPEDIAAVRPLKDGVISDFDLTQALLEHDIRKALPGLSVIAPRVVISVPSGATDVENRAIQDACLQAGARDVYLVEESLACAYGAQLIHEATRGVMVLNIGAGTTEVAVVSGYGVITSETMKKGGDSLDIAIQQYIRDEKRLVIGENMAQQIKHTIGTLLPERDENVMEVSGRDVRTGMPRTETVFAQDIVHCFTPFVDDVIDRLRYTLEKTPPELSADIMRTGIYLTGGGGSLPGLAEKIAQSVHITLRRSKTPMQDTIKGAQYIMKNLKTLKERGGEHATV